MLKELGNCRRCGIYVNILGPRAIQTLLAVGVATNEKFSLAELEVLIHYLWEKSIQAADKAHDQNMWLRLQSALQDRGVRVDVFPRDEKFIAFEDMPARELFHALWSSVVQRPRYIKKEWQLFGRQLSLHGVFV